MADEIRERDALGARMALGDVAVLGFGVTGQALLRYLASARTEGRVGRLAVFGKASPELVRRLGAELPSGIEYVAAEELEGRFDLAIASPGISVLTDFFKSAEAHADEVIGEPEFAWRESPERWIAITGTNGKTTTTTLTAALLEGAGIAARPLGNIGDALIGAVRGREGEWFVAELSSHQLATVSELHPKVAVLLNITPDHLAWHGTLERYAAAKENVFRNLGAHDLAVLVVDDSSAAEVAERLLAKGIRVLEVSSAGRPRTDDAAWREAGRLLVELGGERTELVGADELPIKGTHNVTNALSAAAAALFAGADAGSVREGLRRFEPLSHRVEEVARLEGVTYVDDSKATNTDSVEKALTAFEPGRVVVLLGGTDKGTDLAPLSAEVVRRCRAAVCYGAAGRRIREALEAARDAGAGDIEIASAEHLADAFETARGLAAPGDVVLLSPACSSFDEFSGFEERGDAFKAMVHELGATA